MIATTVLRSSAPLRLVAVILSASFLSACLEVGNPQSDNGAQGSAIGVPQSGPTITLSATPDTVTSGASTSLSWSSDNATSCVASGDWSGDKSTAGSETTAALSTTSTYTLTCNGNGGSTSKSVTVTVTPVSSPELSFSANPTTVVYGSKSTLQWNSTNADSCTASGSWSGNKGKKGNTQTDTLTSNTTYTLTCTNPGGKKTKTVTVTVTDPPPAAPTLSLDANPASVEYLGGTTVTWSATNVTSCTASGAWSGTKSSSGSQGFSSLTSNRTYTLSCTGAGGSVTNSVNVAVADPPAPTLSLSANPTSVAYNSTSTLNWSTSNATSCSASGGWSGGKGTSGAESVGPITSDTSYTLTCSGTGGSVTRTVALSVQAPAAPTISFSASPTSLAAGDSATLSWSVTNATDCSASGAWSGSKGTSGSESVGPVNATSTFSLSCTGPGGTSNRSRTVSVIDAPTVTLSANPTSVLSGDSTTLTWSSSGATSCSAQDAWSGTKATSGSQATASLTGDSTFTLACTGTGGTTTRSVTVTVTTASARSVQISWDAPTTRADGSTLTNLAGFHIHYGTVSGEYTQTIDVNNPSLSSYQIDNLTTGTYYFAVTAYDADSIESAYSMEVSTTLN